MAFVWRLLQGMELAAKVLKAAGATAMYTWQEAATCTWSSDPSTLPGEADFDAYLRNMHATGMWCTFAHSSA